MTATFGDPDAAILLPDGWQTAPASELRKQVEQGAALGPSDAIKAAYQQLLTDIDAEWVRLFAFGPSGFAPWQGTLTIEVTDAKSIEAQVDRVTAIGAAFAKPKTSEQTKVTLPIGTGVRLEQTADPAEEFGPGAVAARGIHYVVELPDGRIMWFMSTGPEASATFADMIDAAVGTLSLR